MKRSTPLMVAAVIFVALFASILLVQRSRLAVVPPATIGNRLWNAYQDARLRYFVPSEKFSGTIDGISPTCGSFLLSTTPTCGLPVTIDPAERGPFENGSVKVGDRVTVSVRTRVSPSRKYGQYYLRKIQVDFAGYRHAVSPEGLPDFAKPVELSITPRRRDAGLAFGASTELAPDRFK